MLARPIATGRSLVGRGVAKKKKVGGVQCKKFEKNIIKYIIE